jgi:hypothetical protein
MIVIYYDEEGRYSYESYLGKGVLPGGEPWQNHTACLM